MIPETFKPAADAQKNQLAKVPLQPPDRLEGRFTAAERLPGGWYQQGNDSMLSTGGGGLPSSGKLPFQAFHLPSRIYPGVLLSCLDVSVVVRH